MVTTELRKQPTILWILIFAVSMGFFESSIVVYLREIYYPDGFVFPLHPIEPRIGATEIIREFFSLVMIISVAILAKRSFYERFANFLFIFAIWDIFYYIFLKLILGWPTSLATWDILFLIPLPWTSPVIAPIIISLIMIGLAFVIYRFHHLNKAFEIKIREWIILIGGAVIIFISFLLDFLRFFITNFEKYSHHPVLERLRIASGEYHPSSFNWIVYLIGVITLIIAIVLIYKTNEHKKRKLNFKE
jgi:hypothetical protein